MDMKNGESSTPPSNDPAETLPRQGKMMPHQENVFPHQVWLWKSAPRVSVVFPPEIIIPRRNLSFFAENIVTFVFGILNFWDFYVCE